jgi:hypothetical protein
MKQTEPGYGEGDLLRKQFSGKRGLRAQIARDYKQAGLSEPLIGQHLNGGRPISLRAAITYCRALNCALDDISPSWANEIRQAAQTLKQPEQPWALHDSATDSVRYTIRENLAKLMLLAQALGDEEIDYLIAKARGLGAFDPSVHALKSVGNGL